MKKAVLSDKIYMNFSEELYELVKLACTYKLPSKAPKAYKVKDHFIIKKNYSIIGKRIIAIPIGRQELIPDDYEIIDKRIYKPVKFPKFKFKLRESQKLIYDQVEDNCLINANVSWGKTFTAVAIATKLKQKTLVITHTVALRKQWEEEIEKTLDIKPGIIGSGIYDIKDKPIVVANVQTLRKHVQALKDEFGTVILDEVHHAPARIFAESLQGMRARYKIGLSATLRRKDFMHILIPDYFSKVVYTPPKENQMKPEILIVKTDIPFSSNNMIPWASRVNELVARPEYLDIVTTVALQQADKGHMVLIVSDRTEFLEKCGQVCGDRAAVVTGATKDREEIHKQFRKQEKDILCGAISIYKEGISENYLSCLILAAPINNDPLLEQLIGRIQRKQENKLVPLVVDIVLKGATARKQAATRAGRYMRERYKVTLIDLS